MTRYNATSHGIFSSAEVIEAVDGEGSQEIHTNIVARVWLEVAPVGIIEEDYAWQIVDIFWRRRRLMRWEGAVINSELSPRTSVPKREQITLSPAMMVLLEIPYESSAPEPQGSAPIGPVDAGLPSDQDQQIERPRAGLLCDPDLSNFLRYDTYLTNKLGKIYRELKRLQDARIDRPSPETGSRIAAARTEESPA